MMIGGAPMGSVALGGLVTLNQRKEGVIDLAPFSFVIEGVKQDSILVDTFEMEQTLGERSTASFEMVNPVTLPTEGDEVEIDFGGDRLFAGTIEEIERVHNAPHTRQIFRVQCVDWFRIAERKLVSLNQTNTPTATAITYVHDTYLKEEGLLLGNVDSGPILIEFTADSVNAAQVLADVAEAAALAIWYDTNKVLQARKTTNLRAGISLDDATLMTLTTSTKRDQYRNKQTVKVTGTGGNVATISRQDSTEIAARIAEDGGTGLYEGYDAIEHPTSDVTADLELYGHTFAFIKLRIFGDYDSRVSGRTRSYGMRIGDLCSITSAAYGIAGTWIIEQLRRTTGQGRFLISEFDAVLSNLYALGKGSLLKIAEAGRAAIVFDITAAGASEEFTTSQSWNVPGAGDVDLQIECYGPGGGGGGGLRAAWLNEAFQCGPFCDSNGGIGGAGGKATTLITLPAGTTLTITITAAGSAGANGTKPSIGACIASLVPVAGGTGGLAKVENGAALLAQGSGGDGGAIATESGLVCYHGGSGAAGSGTGDVVQNGEGSAGGAGGVGGGAQPTAGSSGKVIIRY